MDPKLQTALAKRAQGRGLKNSEITLLKKFDKDPFGTINTTPLRKPKTGRKEGAVGPQYVGRDAISPPGDEVSDLGALEGRIAALEAKLAAVGELTTVTAEICGVGTKDVVVLA